MGRRIVSKLTINHLFFRMLVYYLSLLLPIIVVGMFFYYNSIEKMKNDFADKIELNLFSSASMIDTLMSSAQETSRNFFYDNTVRSLLLPYHLYNDDERARISLIPQALSSVTLINSRIVESVFVYVDESRVYTIGGMDDYSLFFGKTLKYDDYDQDFWKGLLSITRSIAMLKPTEIEMQYGHRVPVVPLVLNDSIRGYNVVMVLNLSINAVNNLLRNNSIFSSSVFVVLDHDGNTVFSDLPADDAALLVHRASLDRKDNRKYWDIDLSGRSYVLAHTTSSLYGWQYFLLTPAKEFTDQAQEILNLILTICLVLLLIGVVLSIAFTFNLYTPIRNISNILKKKEVDLPGETSDIRRNELDYIGLGVMELIRHSDSYKDKLNVMSTEYLDGTLVHLLQSNRAQDIGKVEAMLADHFRMRGSEYLVCCLKFKYKPLFYEEMKHTDTRHIEVKLGRVAGGLLNGFVQVYSVNLKPGLIALVVNMKEAQEKEYLIKGLNNLFEVFHYDSRYCIIHAGVGRSYPSLKHIFQSCGEALTAVACCESNESFQCIDAADMEIRNSFLYSFMDENKVINGLKTGDFDNLEMVVEEIFRANIGKKVSHHCLHMLLSEMFNTGQRTAAEMGLHNQDMIEKAQDWLDRAPMMELEEKKVRLLAFFQAIIDKMAVYQDHKSGEWTAEILKYIEERYREDLYLEKIADHMHLSAKHISRVFKETTGMNVTDYISMYRINKAKELMRDTNLSISHISEQVGIYSRTTFIRLFKKFEGITPNEYRKIK